MHFIRTMIFPMLATKFKIIPSVDQPCRPLLLAGALSTVLLLGTPAAQADYKSDVSYTALQSELGAGMPDGNGIPVSHVEASIQIGTNPAWMPDTGNAEFTGKTITDVSGAIPGVFSGHATAVGRKFYGNVTSTSPGITTIASLLADHWLGSGFLRVNTGGSPVYQPLSSASRISNHSWVGNARTYNMDALARLDWAIETDEMVQTVGFNGTATNPLLSSAYNVISVNNTAAPTTAGSASAGGIYTSGRTKPEIVAPANNTSSATPRVASAAALLIEVAHNNPGLSTDPAATSTANRNGDTIYNAERVEIIKAALMAGADRATGNSTSTDITDYRVAAADQTTNGLDRRFGAGQLNISNSYHIIAAGEQNSVEDQPGGAGLIGATGFDYDPAFGGSGGSNSTATYYFAPTAGPARLTVALAWNLSVAGGTPNNFNGTATLYDLDLQLYDVTDPGNWILVGNSQSTTENTENLWQLLDSGKNYALRVQRGVAQAAFKWDYGLAWQATPVPPLAIDPVVLPIAYWNEVYPAQTLTAAGGQPPYSWSVVSGALPPGLTISPNGVISGTPTTFGLTSFTVQAADTASNTATVDVQISVQSRGYVCGVCHAATGF